MERNHFWFKGRRKIISQLLKQHFQHRDKIIIDIGCGTGSMVHYLVEQEFNVIGIDVHSNGFSKNQTHPCGNRLVQGDALQIPFAKGTFQMALMLDIMEHTDDDQLLKQVYECLTSDGAVLISVPAIPWLWSYRDEGAGHLRRYTLRHLKNILEANNFKIQVIRRYQFFAIPILILSRLLGKCTHRTRDMEDNPHPIVNLLMTWLTSLEIELGQIISLPWGSTIIVLCQRYP